MLFYKLVQRENKKRKITQASTSRTLLEEPVWYEEKMDENDFWDNLNIKED